MLMIFLTTLLVPFLLALLLFLSTVEHIERLVHVLVLVKLVVHLLHLVQPRLVEMHPVSRPGYRTESLAA